MSVHKRKNGRWVYQYKDNRTGKYKQEYFGCSLDVEKRAWKRNKELVFAPYSRPYTCRKPQDSSIKTFKDLAVAHYESKQVHNEESILVALRYKLTGVILKEIGETEIFRLTHHRMDQYVIKRLKHGGKDWKGVTHTTREALVQIQSSRPFDLRRKAAP